MPNSELVQNRVSAKKESNIASRTFDFSLLIIKLCRKLDHDNIGRVLGKQLIRSGTSIGANVREAQGSQSKADFISKISIAQKEALETEYWLRLILADKLISGDEILTVLNESAQLIKILSSILISSKKNAR